MQPIHIEKEGLATEFRYPVVESDVARETMSKLHDVLVDNEYISGTGGTCKIIVDDKNTMLVGGSESLEAYSADFTIVNEDVELAHGNVEAMFVPDQSGGQSSIMQMITVDLDALVDAAELIEQCNPGGSRT
jgi:hypothetical protein